MRKLLSFMILSLFLLTLVNAAPPQASQAEYGLDIRTGVADNLKLNTAYDFHVHVFNASDGNFITTDTTCYLHIYKIDGHHQYEGVDSVASHNFDYGFDVNGANFSEVGEYEYIIQCNNSNSGGFVSNKFHVNETGNPNPAGNLMIFLMILGLIVFFSLLYALLIVLKDFTEVNVSVKTISIAFGAYFANLAYYYYLTMFMPINLMLDLSYIGISVFGITHLFLPLVGLIFSWIKNGGQE